jgi:membrane protease YdiL (CAAX protease family)
MIDAATLLLVSEWLGVIAVVTLAAIGYRTRRRPLIFEFPQREGIVASMLYVSILAVSFVFYNKFSIPSGVLPPLNQRIVVAGVCALPFILALLIRRQPWLSAGLGKSNFALSIRLGLILVLLVVILRGKVNSLLHGVTLEQGEALLFWLGICILEESIFRGYIQSRLCSWMGDIPGWLTSSALYAVWGIPRLMLNPATFGLSLAVLLVQGMVLGWIFLKSGHVAAPAIYRAVSEWISLLI